MSRKRDTNWTRDEITVLLDSIEEMTRMRADGGRRTNSREVFEFAAKKLGEKGHTSRAEREKCRTKWKKMKEEFTHARRARETGQGRVAPGIEPFYSRMLEFINGNFDNISPHSTIVRRSSSISSNNTSNNNGNSNNGHTTSSTINGADSDINQVNHNISLNNNRPAPSITPTNHSKISHAASRTSARLAANSSGVSSNDTSDTANAIETRPNNVGGPEFSPGVSTSSDLRPRQNTRVSSASLPGNIDNSNGRFSNSNNGNTRTYVTSATNGTGVSNNHDHNPAEAPKQITYDDNSYSNHIHDNSSSFNNTTNNNSSLNNSNDFTNHLPPAERDADISYRVSTGCRQIIIFGDHDVDIKFRGDCVTINKISSDYTNATASVNSPDT